MGTEGDSGEGTGCKQYNRDRPELVKQGPAVSPGTGSHTNRPSGGVWVMVGSKTMN